LANGRVFGAEIIGHIITVFGAVHHDKEHRLLAISEGVSVKPCGWQARRGRFVVRGVVFDLDMVQLTLTTR